MILTYADLRDHTLDYLGGATDPENERKARIAVQAGYRDLTTMHRWSLYLRQGRITTSAPYSTGTISYAATTNQVTLTGGTWPTWAARGVIRLDNVPYDVEERVSGTVIQLTIAHHPAANISSGAAYQIFQEIYQLPTDFMAMDDIQKLNSGIQLVQVPAREWLKRYRLMHTPAESNIFSILGDPDYLGSLAVVFSPPPHATETYTFLYQRRPLELRILDYHEGTVSVTADAGAVTGVGTAWTEDLEGTIIRFGGASDEDAPSGPTGKNPAVMTRVVLEVTSATALTLDENSDRTLSGVKYSLSSAADVEEGAMATALLRECERQARIFMRPVRSSPTEERMYTEAIERARENDSRTIARSYAGRAPMGEYWPRLRDYPSGD